MPQPLIEPLCWIAIGMGLANAKFGAKLDREVGPHAFPGLLGDVYRLVELGPPFSKDEFARILQVTRRDGEKLSDVVVRTLTFEAEHAWANRQNPVAILAAKIKRDCALLEGWATRMKNVSQLFP